MTTPPPSRRHAAPLSAALRNPAFGLRDIGEVSTAGSSFGFRLLAVQDMPANNFMLTFAKEKEKQESAAQGARDADSNGSSARAPGAASL